MKNKEAIILYHSGKTIYCDGFETCEDCPRYADDCDGDPDKMGEEE